MLSHAAHIFCRLFLQGLSLSLFGRLVIVPVDSFHCFPTLSSLYFSLSLSLKCHLAFLFLFRWFISTGLLACCFDCSTNEIGVCVCVCVFGLRLCLSTRSVFSASPWTPRSSQWCSTQAFRLYEHLSTSSFPSLTSFSSASYIIAFSLCVFHSEKLLDSDQRQFLMFYPCGLA